MLRWLKKVLPRTWNQETYLGLSSEAFTHDDVSAINDQCIRVITVLHRFGSGSFVQDMKNLFQQAAPDYKTYFNETMASRNWVWTTLNRNGTGLNTSEAKNQDDQNEMKSNPRLFGWHWTKTELVRPRGNTEPIRLEWHRTETERAREILNRNETNSNDFEPWRSDGTSTVFLIILYVFEQY